MSISWLAWIRQSRHINCFDSMLIKSPLPGSWWDGNQSMRQTIGVSYMLNSLLASGRQLALASLNCTLKYRWREEGISKRKELEWGKLMFVRHKETGLTYAIDFFFYSSRGVHFIPMGIEKVIERSLCSFSAGYLCWGGMNNTCKFPCLTFFGLDALLAYRLHLVKRKLVLLVRALSGPLPLFPLKKRMARYNYWAMISAHGAIHKMLLE